jgi:hypothetical protein
MELSGIHFEEEKKNGAVSQDSREESECYRVPEKVDTIIPFSLL